jgi:hypothetical protein
MIIHVVSHVSYASPFINVLGQYPCVATGTYNIMITYIQNVPYIVIRKYFIIHL